MKPLLNIQQLSTGYRLKKGKVKLLHQNLSATVNAGELIAILGPNGAGKSTLLRTLLGYNPAFSGTIEYSGNKIEDISIKKMATLVSVVLTDKIDDLYLTAGEVIVTARYPYSNLFGKLTEKDNEIVNNAIEITGVENFKHRKLHTLSDGERQRVMIARAIAQDTPLIFMDEPTAFIDSPGRVELMHLLKTIPPQGKSILMTIHDVELALNFADKLWLLGKDGTFVAGNPEELINNGSINRLFDRGKIKFNQKTKSFV